MAEYVNTKTATDLSGAIVFYLAILHSKEELENTFT